MAIRSTAGHAVTALISAAATGWLMHTPSTDAMPPRASCVTAGAPVTRGTPAASAAVFAEPLIVVASDGNVTLRVEQQPLEWVLEQIAAKSGWSDVKQRAKGTTGPSDAAVPAVRTCAPASVETPANAPGVLRAIERGGEAERYAALLQARSVGIEVPAAKLESLFETDVSERVRLLAFESYVEPLAGNGEALRNVLQAVLAVTDGAVQREAKRRLDELIESERAEWSVRR